jgi:hypothetical protein
MTARLSSLNPENRKVHDFAPAQLTPGLHNAKLYGLAHRALGVRAVVFQITSTPLEAAALVMPAPRPARDVQSVAQVDKAWDVHASSPAI